MALRDRLTASPGDGGANASARRWDRYNFYLYVFSATSVALTVLAIIVFLGVQGLKTFAAVSPLQFFFTAKWAPGQAQFGAGAFIVGSLLVTGMALLIGGPLGLLTAVFLAKVAPKGVRGILRPAVDLFVGIPSVVYGWVGLTVIVPYIREHLAPGSSGFGLLAAGGILGIMILPTMAGVADDALRALPRSLEEGALALGATRWQAIWQVLVPAARAPILTGAVLAMARAIGETMAVQMVIGNSPLLPAGLATPTATLTSEIVMEMGNAPAGTPWNDALFLMAFLLLAISLGLILAVRAIGRGAAYGRA